MESASAWDAMFTFVLPDCSAIDRVRAHISTYIPGWNRILPHHRLQRAVALRADKRKAASSGMPQRWDIRSRKFQKHHEKIIYQLTGKLA
jgi:hypothetical protein